MKFIILLLFFIGAFYWFTRIPSVEDIMGKTSYDVEKGRISWDGKEIFANWGRRERIGGYLRYFGRAYDKNAPFITHDTVVTTGDFSDPEKVYVSPIRSGNMYWKSKGETPRGTLVVLHLFPISAEVASQLSELKEGETITFWIREEEDSALEDDQGILLGLQHDNHKFALVEKIE